MGANDLEETHHCLFDDCTTPEQHIKLLEIQGTGEVIKDWNGDGDDLLLCRGCAQGCPVDRETMKPMRLGGPGAGWLFEEENEWYRRSGWF